MLLTQESQVSEKMVPRQRFQIQPDDGSNCIMMGPLALVLTLSSIKRSSRFCVEACSIIDSGVVSTIRREEDEGVDACDFGGIQLFRLIHDMPVRASDVSNVAQDKKKTNRTRRQKDDDDENDGITLDWSVLCLVLLRRLITQRIVPIASKKLRKAGSCGRSQALNR